MSMDWTKVTPEELASGVLKKPELGLKLSTGDRHVCMVIPNGCGPTLYKINNKGSHLAVDLTDKHILKSLAEALNNQANRMVISRECAERSFKEVGGRLIDFDDNGTELDAPLLYKSVKNAAEELEAVLNKE